LPQTPFTRWKNIVGNWRFWSLQIQILLLSTTVMTGKMFMIVLFFMLYLFNYVHDFISY
jgi:hypothetical protein